MELSVCRMVEATSSIVLTALTSTDIQKSDGKNVHMPTVTFGGLDVYEAVAAVARRAMKGACFHKWCTHLRLAAKIIRIET